jgi:hypothetical protein
VALEGKVAPSMLNQEPLRAGCSKTPRPRFENYKTKHQSLAIPLAVVRSNLSGPALAWYMILRTEGDWSTGVLPEHCTPEWLQDKYNISRRQRLTRERELRVAGLFESVQTMKVKRIRGRMRWVKQNRVARVLAEPSASQIINTNAGSFSVPFLSRLKNGTPDSSKELDSKALPSGKVKTEIKREIKSSSLPLDRPTPRSPEPPQPSKACSDSELPDLTREQPKGKPPGWEKPKAQPKFRTDLLLSTVLKLQSKFLEKAEDLESWRALETTWREARCPVDRMALVEFLERFIVARTRDGSGYFSFMLKRKKQLERRDFSPNLPEEDSLASQWTAPAGACTKCGDTGLAVAPGGTSASFCGCAAGRRLMFPKAAKGGA